MIYFDNSATTRCCDEAVAIMTEALQVNYGNPSSLHGFGMEGENYVKNARATIARTLRCQEKEIYFTSGGSESNNLAILGIAEARKRQGNHVITTSIEHASVANPVKYLEKLGYEVTYLNVDEYGVVSMDDFKAAMRQDTILVTVMMVNNEIGAIAPVQEMGDYIKANFPNCAFHIDAIQSYGKIDINLKKIKADLLSVSGHKIHGPKGSGFLFVRDRVRVIPQILGGGQEKGMRSGTENVPAIAGLGVASGIVFDNLEANRSKMFALRKQLIEGLLQIDGISVNGHIDENSAPHIVSVSVKGVRAEVLLHALEDKGIYVSAGSACSSNKPAISRTLTAIGLPKELLDSTVRFSFCPENTSKEVEEALMVLRELVPTLQKYSRH